MQNARKTAEVIATESGYRLGRLISVVERYFDRRSEANAVSPYDDPDATSIEFCLSEDDAMDAMSYTGLQKNTAYAERRFHVRFSADAAE